MANPLDPYTAPGYDPAIADPFIPEPMLRGEPQATPVSFKSSPPIANGARDWEQERAMLASRALDPAAQPGNEPLLGNLPGPGPAPEKSFDWAAALPYIGAGLADAGAGLRGQQGNSLNNLAIQQQQRQERQRLQQQQQQEEQQKKFAQDFEQVAMIDKNYGDDPERWESGMNSLAARGNPIAKTAKAIGAGSKYRGQFDALIGIIQENDPELAAQYRQDPRSVPVAKIKASAEFANTIQTERMKLAAEQSFIKTIRKKSVSELDEVELRHLQEYEKKKIEVEEAKAKLDKLKFENTPAGRASPGVRDILLSQQPTAAPEPQGMPSPMPQPAGAAPVGNPIAQALEQQQANVVKQEAMKQEQRIGTEQQNAFAGLIIKHSLERKDGKYPAGTPQVFASLRADDQQKAIKMAQDNAKEISAAQGEGAVLAQLKKPIGEHSQLWRDPSSRTALNAKRTPEEIYKTYGDKQKSPVVLQPTQVGAVNSINTTLEKLDIIERQSGKILRKYKAQLGSDIAAGFVQRIALLAKEHAGDPDLAQLNTAINTSLAQLQRLSGDTGNIAVAEQQIIRENILHPTDSVEALNERVGVIRNALGTTLEGMGFDNPNLSKREVDVNARLKKYIK